MTGDDEEWARHYHESLDRSLDMGARPEMVAWAKHVTEAIERELMRGIGAGHSITGVARGFIFRTGLNTIAERDLPSDMREGAFMMVISMLVAAADADDDDGERSSPRVKKPTDGETVDG